MARPSELDWATQSSFSDPGAFADLFDAIEPTVEAASAVARNVIVHYREAASALPADTGDDQFDLSNLFH